MVNAVASQLRTLHINLAERRLDSSFITQLAAAVERKLRTDSYEAVVIDTTDLRSYDDTCDFTTLAYMVRSAADKARPGIKLAMVATRAVREKLSSCKLLCFIEVFPTLEEAWVQQTSWPTGSAS